MLKTRPHLPLRIVLLLAAVGRGCLLAASAWPVFGASAEAVGVPWAGMAVELFGGLAIFLYGMLQMEGALKAVAGERAKGILARLTATRWMGVATGALVTAVIQ